MALIVTPGAADADSYATLAAADAYHTARGNATWTGADAVKESALRRATSWLDGTYGARWAGLAVNGRSQPLGWPRLDALDFYGNEVDDTTIPDEVVTATIEAALRELVEPGSLSPDVTPGRQVRSETVGPLSVTYTGPVGVAGLTPLLSIVDAALSTLIGRGGVKFVERA